ADTAKVGGVPELTVQALEPEYRKAAAKLKGLAKLVQVDCDNSSNRDLCGRFNVQGFPTIKLFSAGPKGMPSDYQGERTAKAIVETVTSMIPGKHVYKLGGSSKKALSLDQFKEKESGRLAKVLLATEKKTTPTLFKALSIEYLDRLVFGEVKKTQSAIVEALEITSFPAILVFPKDGGSPVVYPGRVLPQPLTSPGAVKQDELVQFLDQYALPAPKKRETAKPKKDKPKTNKKPKEEKTKLTEPMEPFDDSIQELTCQNCLETKCLKMEGVCVIAFLTEEKEFPESVAAFKDNINILQAVKKKYHSRKTKLTIVYANAIDHGRKLINDFGVSDMFPSMIVFDPAKSQYGLLRNAFEESKITSFLDEFLSGKGRLVYSKDAVLDSAPKKTSEQPT
ncbi:hypothetical protein HDU91_001747, partial [Kappamyces sp. JEL0680]